MASNQTVTYEKRPETTWSCCFRKNTALASVGYAMLMMPNKAEAAVLVCMRTLLSCWANRGTGGTCARRALSLFFVYIYGLEKQIAKMRLKTLEDLRLELMSGILFYCNI